MVNSVEINNFRGFDRFKVEDLAPIAIRHSGQQDDGIEEKVFQSPDIPGSLKCLVALWI